MTDELKTRLEKLILILLSVIAFALVFTACIGSDDKLNHLSIPAALTPAEPEGTQLFKEKFGLPIPFTTWRIGGFTKAYMQPPKDKPSRMIARKYIIWFLLVVASLSFICIPAGLFAALYYKWGGGYIMAALGGLTFFVAGGSAYFFDWIMWVWLAGFVICIISGIYWAFREHKFKHVTGQLVATGETLKSHLRNGGEWSEPLQLNIKNAQSKSTQSIVTAHKVANLKEDNKFDINERKTKAK